MGELRIIDSGQDFSESQLTRVDCSADVSTQKKLGFGFGYWVGYYT